MKMILWRGPSLPDPESITQTLTYGQVQDIIKPMRPAMIRT